MIYVKNLSYNYRTFEKRLGLRAGIKDFFRRKIYKKNILQDISLEIKEGEMVALLGENGAGKTTFIKLLIGILTPDSGQIKVDSFFPFQKDKFFLKNIGVVLGQKSQLIWDLPPIHTLNMLKVIYQIENEEYEKRLSQLTNLLEVSAYLFTPVRKLSLGERVKFELISALIHHPKYLFLDEPTIGLDIFSQKKIYRVLKELNKKENITVILTSHYMKDIEETCKRILLLENTVIRIDMKLSEFKKRYSVKNKIEIVFEEEIPEAWTPYRTEENRIEIDEVFWEKEREKIDISTVYSIVKKEETLEAIMIRLLEKNKEKR